MRNILISTLLSLLFCIPAAGQNIFTIYGKVVDQKSGESIPFAPIRVKGTLTTTTTDTAGLFKITTKFISDSLIIQMLGYQTQSVSIKKVKEQSVQIALKPIGLELSEVTVKSGKRTKPPKDTAAITLYRRVVASKDLNSPDNLDKYAYQSYSKIQLDILNLSKFWQNTIFLKPFRYAFEWKDTLSDGRIAIPALIREKITDYYFQKDPKKTKELVRGVRVSGLENSSMSDLADFQFEYVDPYKNVVRIFNKSFNNPFSPIALSLYRFSIGDTQQIDGRTTYTLQFTPISKEDLVFTGYAQIDSETAAIQYIDMYPNQKANINFLTDYKIKQTFVKLDKQAWFLREENLEAIITLYDGKKQLGAVVRKTQSRNQIDLNPFLPDTIFKGDPIDQPDSVRRRSDEFWDQARHMPLTKREARIYDVVDSLRRTKAYKRYEWLGNSLSSAYVQTGPLEWGRFYQWFSGNQLEGYRLKWGFRTNRKLFSKKLFLEGYIAYGLGDHKWKYFANAKYVFPRKYGRWNQLEVFYKKDLIILGTKDPLISHDNILNLTRRSPLSNVMRISHFNLIYEREWRKGITTWFGFDHKRFFGQPGQIEFIKTNYLGQKETVPYFTVAELNFNSRIGIKEKFYENQFRRRFINNNYPVFFLGYAIGIKDLFGGRFTYHRFDVQIKQRITSPIGWTRLNIVGGYILGDCPFPLLYMTSGNAGRIFDDNNFNLLPAFEFISDKYVTAYVEHHFDGFFFNKIPYFSKLKLREVIWVRAIIGSISNRSTQLYEFPYQIRAPFPKPYVEVGFGIENILKLLRVDFMWRATYRKDPDIQKWAVKFSVAPNF